MTEDICLELKNIQYRTLLTGNIPHSLEQELDITTDTKQVNKMMKHMSIAPKKKKAIPKEPMVVDMKPNLKKQRGRKSKKQVLEELIYKSTGGSTTTDEEPEIIETPIMTWSKMDKATRIQKLNQYIEGVYREKHNLTKDEIIALKNYMKMNLDRKRLCKTKDVFYDKDAQIIRDIPGLQYRGEEIIQHRFTLKAPDKTNTTLKNMTPRKKKKVQIIEE
jgi:hypothetical protein